MAGAIAEGVSDVPGIEVTVKRVPELIQEEVVRKNDFKLDQVAPIATVAELPQYDGILFGTPTRLAICSPKCGASSIKQEDCG
jgi:NAD(P)H dehydrogenase (quinone)